MTLQVFLESIVQPSDSGISCDLLAQGFVEKLGYLSAIFPGESGNPMLFDRVTFVARKAVKRFEMRDVRTSGARECGEGLAEQRGHVGAAFFVHMIPGNQSAEMRGMEQSRVALADSRMSGDKLGFFDEPSLSLIRRFDEQGGFIKEVEGVLRGLLGSALEHEKRAVFR